MGLVDYSDSDVSEAEEIPVVKVVPSASKITFQKVVDRSKPGKIRVNLPNTAHEVEDRDGEPPTKRAKTTEGAFSGFNSFLPTPKRSGSSTPATIGGGAATKRGDSRVSLKTGSGPAFDRGRDLQGGYREGLIEDDGAERNIHPGYGHDLPSPKASLVERQTPPDEVKLVGKPLLFKPLSVTRKPVKKKQQEPLTASTSMAKVSPFGSPNPPPNATPITARPKVSLFSISMEEPTVSHSASAGEYQPMIFERPSKDRADEKGGEDDLGPSHKVDTPEPSQLSLPFAHTQPVSESLDDIAGDLKLSATERRQLFGRRKGIKNGGVPVATKIINFNTDKEYLHNEELRAAGEQPVHNPVRALAPGKHSLKQLVNAVQSQKDALEESFAKGKNNRAEANSRYGFGR